MTDYYVYSGASGGGTGADWANAFTDLTAAFATHAAGDTYYIAHDHDESTGADLRLDSLGTITAVTRIICVDRGGSVPPVSADLRTTASVKTTGSGHEIFFTGFSHYYGIVFTTVTASGIFLSSDDGHMLRFESCSFVTSGNIQTGEFLFTGGTTIELVNTTLGLNNTGFNFFINSRLVWRGTPEALLGTVPNTLFRPVNARGGSLECTGVDFSSLGAGGIVIGDALNSQFSRFDINDCDLGTDAAETITVVNAPGVTDSNFIRCSASGTSFSCSLNRTSGHLTEETEVVRTDDIPEDRITYAPYKIVTTAFCSRVYDFECFPISVWNDTEGSPVTVTIEGVWGEASVPTNAEAWVDVEYLGDASSPRCFMESDGVPDPISDPEPQDASTATWQGDDAVTPFKLVVTFTPQLKGMIFARVRLGKPSATFYIQPKITLS